MSNITNEWPKIKLGDISEVITNKISVSKLGKNNYISTENMLSNRLGICEATNLPNILLTPSFQVNDILVSNIRPYFKKIWYAKFYGGCSNDVLIFRAKKNIDSKFLYYVLSSDDFFEYAMSTSKGTKMPRGDKIAIMNYSVPKLDIATQKKIAAVLSALDDKIELNNKINQNLEQQAQALFDTIYESKNNGILSDIVATVESGNRPKGGALANGIPSIGAENIEKFGVYDYSKEKFVDAAFFEQMKRGKVKSEDVLLYKDGAYTGKVSLALDGFPHEVCAVNEHVFIIRAKQNVSSPFFLYFCLYNKNNRDYLYKLASSKAAQPGLNKEELLNLPIFIPDLQLIRNFSSSIAPMMHKIATNALENKKLAQLRDALLPKLMSGEVDVSKVSISI